MSSKKNVLTIEKEVKPIQPVTIKSKVTFSFESDGESGLDLMAADASGDTWYLLKFGNDGVITKYSGIPEDLGFDVNEEGELIITG